MFDSTKKKPRLLAIDDEPEIGRFIAAVARLSDYEAQSVAEARAFQAAYLEWQPDVVSLDIAIPETDGIELLSFLRGEASRARIVIISGFGGPMLDVASRLGSAYELDIMSALAKPVRVLELKAVLEAVRHALHPRTMPVRSEPSAARTLRV